MKAHIGVDVYSCLVHTVVDIGTNVNDVRNTSQLVHGEAANVFTDGNYQGVGKRK